MSYAAHDRRGSGGGYDGGGISFPAALRSFRRRIPLMLVIFFALSALGWYFGGQLKRTYTAEARMIVTLSDEYVYHSMQAQDSTGNGLVMTPDSITLNEIAIMNNPSLIDGVISSIGISRLFPVLGPKYAAAQGLERDHLMHEMLSKFEGSYWVAARPKSSVIDMQFEHEDPRVAKDTLEALIAAYKDARLIVFKADAQNVIGDRREATEKQLSRIDSEIAYFLKRNKIADFESERTGVRERTEALRAELNALRGSMREAEASLASTEDRLRTTRPTIDLYVDDRASQRIAQAELERKQLLAKYLPSSDPVKAKEIEIAELRQLINASGGAATGGRRVGPNPVHQALTTQRNTVQALADSYREKEYVLQSQLNSADAKVARLTALNPQYENLLREKKTLEASLETLNAREQVALVEQAQANLNNQNVKPINEPGLSRKGRNIKKIVQFLSIIGAALTALMVGMLGVFLDPSIYGTPRGIGQTRADAASEADYDAPSGQGYYQQTVPEPVQPAAQPYVPQEAPAYAPAAASAAGYGMYDQGQAYDQGGQYAAQNGQYAYPADAATGYPQGSDQGATMDGGSTGYSQYAEASNPYAMAAGQDFAPQYAQNPYAENPYGGAIAQPQMQPQMQHQEQYQEAQHIVGPNGEQIPVIGQADSGPAV